MPRVSTESTEPTCESVWFECPYWPCVQEPAWLKARRIKKAYIQDHVSHRLLGMLEENSQDEILSTVQNPALAE